VPQPPRVVRIAEVEPFADGEVRWHPLRYPLGVTGFGVNAFSGDSGDRVIEEHDEVSGAAGGHDELYVVIAGRATFTVDGDEIDAPPGTLVQVGRESRRTAFAADDGTIVLVLGARPGEPFVPSPWETSSQAALYAKRGQPAEARKALAEALREHGDHPHALYNAACAEALLGERAAALEHLTAALAGEPKAREWMQHDSDLDSLRDDPAFPG
jgi:quercetin dioxygenase-like cupin family protein